MELGWWTSLGRFWFKCWYHFKESLKLKPIHINVATPSPQKNYLVTFKWMFILKKRNLWQNMPFLVICVSFWWFFAQKISGVYPTDISFNFLILCHWQVAQQNLTLYDDRFLKLASIHEKHGLKIFTKLKLESKCDPKNLKFDYDSMKKWDHWNKLFPFISHFGKILSQKTLSIF
jgi:hypothetical protein